MRKTLSLFYLAVLLAAAATGVAAQVPDPPVSPRSWGVGPTVAAGSSRTLTAAVSASAFLDLTGNVRLRAEAGRVRQGLNPCEDAWPWSLECSASPIEALAGFGVIAHPFARLGLTGEILGGVNRMNLEELGGSAPAIRIAGGLETPIGTSWDLALTGYWSTAYNEQYRALLGNRPTYVMVALGLRYRASLD